ncbi:hypothetical protein Vafri_19140 [Volvox africanus]|uniref:Uncharacterized protein n=1 Tax=Volvox africanus TaxID=51714 RepID=A0A8J4BNY0_9CHLO|nr:hypothetical protein Vafri_19140 [Volvox africanus]
MWQRIGHRFALAVPSAQEPRPLPFVQLHREFYWTNQISYVASCEGSVPFRFGYGSLHSAIRALCTSAGPDEPEDVAAMRQYRDSKSFRRRFDGRVLLHGKESNTWMEAKLDGYVEGEDGITNFNLYSDSVRRASSLPTTTYYTGGAPMEYHVCRYVYTSVYVRASEGFIP